MQNDALKEISVGAGLILLLILLLNPFGIYMPSQATMLVMGAVAILALVFLSFMWKETAHDERESLHRLLAGRTAFLAGAGILLIGITVQTFQHRLDPWLALALGAMVVAKLAARVYSRSKY